jgi:nucleoside-diphosphate-sugar epimerase
LFHDGTVYHNFGEALMSKFQKDIDMLLAVNSADIDALEDAITLIDKCDLEKFKNVVINNKVDAIIHLACVSNDPSFELDPGLGKSINFDCFESLVKISKDNGVKRFIYASSSSVYGVKEDEQVTENLSLEPLTDYSKYKALCEDILLKYNDKNFVGTIVRPATICGYSKRLRLDLSVNILTSHAYF